MPHTHCVYKGCPLGCKSESDHKAKYASMNGRLFSNKYKNYYLYTKVK